ncbi:MAG: heme exporter protein CcmD [Parvibaculales bacterium]
MSYGFYITASYVTCFGPLLALILVSYRQWAKAKADLAALETARHD